MTIIILIFKACLLAIDLVWLGRNGGSPVPLPAMSPSLCHTALEKAAKWASHVPLEQRPYWVARAKTTVAAASATRLWDVCAGIWPGFPFLLLQPEGFLHDLWPLPCPSDCPSSSYLRDSTGYSCLGDVWNEKKSTFTTSFFLHCWLNFCILLEHTVGLMECAETSMSIFFYMCIILFYVEIL